MEKENIKINLATAILKSHYDLSTLAHQLGISQTLLDDYVKGKKLPSVVIFANICKILNLDTNEILGNKKSND